MDRQLLDDLFCFTTILNNYFKLEIERLDSKIEVYRQKIKGYEKRKADPLINSNALSALDYGIAQNIKRIELITVIKKEFSDEMYNIQAICDKYYYDKDFMSLSYINRNFEAHNAIITSILLKYL